MIRDDKIKYPHPGSRALLRDEGGKATDADPQVTILQHLDTLTLVSTGARQIRVARNRLRAVPPADALTRTPAEAVA